MLVQPQNTYYITNDALIETTGLSLNAQTRTELMMKLSRDPALLPKQPPAPSPTILLTHMYDPEEETEAHWEYAIADEVREECQKYGHVMHLSVQKTKSGEVYLKFGSVQAGQAAVAALGGRWFGGKQITATYVPTTEYQRLFPSS